MKLFGIPDIMWVINEMFVWLNGGQQIYTLQGPKVLSTPINEISSSKEVLIIYRRAQGFAD